MTGDPGAAPGDQLRLLTEFRDRLAAELTAARAETDRLRRRIEALYRRRPVDWPLDRLVGDLLRWADTVARGDDQWLLAADEWPLAAALPLELVRRTVRHLAGDGWAESEDGAARFRLTVAGVREADRRAAAVRSRREVLAHAENTLLAWAYEHDRDGEPLRLADFRMAVQAHLYGREFEVDEVREAAEGLAGLGLLTGPEGAGEAVRLTHAGRDCALSGRPVRAYGNEKEYAMSQTTNNFFQMNGGHGAQGPGASQHIGVQPDQLAELIRALRQFASSLEERDREQFLLDVAVLEDTDRSAADRSGAWQRVRGGLAAVGSGVLVNGLVELGSQLFAG